MQSTTCFVFVDLEQLARTQTRMMLDGTMKPARYLIPFLCESLHEIQDRAGVARGRMHDFQATFCSRLASAHIPLHELQRLSGHGDIATLAKFYLAPQEGAADRVRAALASVA
ncbi:MAG: hypothetical protein IID30_01250 [Planctomycetes bacterium]|nr:hypothetical protein [Planctomycetota bacterium]